MEQDPVPSVVDWGSTHVYIPSTTDPILPKSTTNVLLLPFSHLNSEPFLATGDPVPCSTCGALLSYMDKLNPSETVFEWTCQFCDTVNTLGEDALGGYRECMDFLIETGQKKEEENSELVMFLIDVSGSMTQTTAVPDPQFPNEEDKIRYISKLDFLKSAVSSQLDTLALSKPNIKVGLITFGTTVSIYEPDGVKSEKIEGPILQEYASLLEKGYDYNMDKTISETVNSLKNTINDLKEGGTTALGPALVIAVAICSKFPGSKCILCTDGVANVGVGNLTYEKKEGELDFYQEIGQFAKRKGVIISVISIKGVETKLEKLGAIADITKGHVDLVDSENLNFTSLLTSEVFATNVSLDLFLPKTFTFTREPDWTKNGNYTKITHDLGNAVPSSQITYEFSLHDLSVVPQQFLCQIQILYTKRNGNKYKRVYTVRRPMSRDLEEVERNLDIQTISAHLAKMSAKMAQGGKYMEALQNAMNVKELVAKRVTPEQSGLWEIFETEYVDISKALTIEKARMTGRNSLGREGDMNDYTAKKLYNYKASQAHGCTVQ